MFNIDYWHYTGKNLMFIIDLLQESDKGQIFYWSIQTCTRIMLSIDC